MGRVTSAQSIEPDEVLVEVNLAADGPVGPRRVDGEGPSLEGDTAFISRASQEDDGALGGSLQIEFPVIGEGAPVGGALSAGRGPLTMGGNVALRSLTQGCQRGVMETGPDLRLPEAIEILNGGLEAHLARWDKDRRNVQTEAQSRDRSDHIAMLMRTLEARVIVKLRIVG